MKTLQQYLQQQQLSKRTIKEYTGAYNRLILWLEKENLDITAVSYTDLTAYIRYLRRCAITHAVIINTMNALKYVFKWQISEQQRTTNPAIAIQIKKKSLQKVLTCLPEERLQLLYTQFLNYSPYNRQKDIRAQLLYTITIGFIIYQGLNSKTLQGLLTTDINLAEGNVYIAENPLSNARILPLNAGQIMPIMQYLNTCKQEKLYNRNMGNFLFALQQRIYKVTGEHITIRQLIDSRIILWLKQYNIRQVQYYCGFKYVSSLKKYQQQQMDGLKEMVIRFHPLG